MNKTKITYAIEYLSPTIILSYFWLHNILLVLFGIIFSLYLININFIDRIISSINQNFVFRIVSREQDKYVREPKANSIKQKSIKGDSALTLVEKVEELGFIPSIEKNNDSNTA
tara:strand:- start:82 stop:423 length:342 start_codon:yes stop_codon:yes gene_type:complete